MAKKKIQKKSGSTIKPDDYVFGRPKKYDPKYCKMVIEAGKRGETLTEFAAKIEVDRNTLYNWRKDYTDFFSALKRHKVHCRQYYIKQARKMAEGRAQGSNAMMAMFLKNIAAFKDDPVTDLDDDILDDAQEVHLEFDNE